MLEPLGLVLGYVGAAVFVYVTIWFALSLILKRNDIADIAWGPGIALVALVAFLVQEEPTTRMSILLALAVLWALRLALHIGLRALKKPEDARYKVWRETWKFFVLRSYAQVFLLQGALMIVVGYGFVHASALDTGGFGAFGVLGVLVWLFGFVFETISDWQLRQFVSKEENRGKLMRYGLWKYSRHPNYFGEVVQWWGIWLVILPLSWSAIALVSPLAITYLILRVSGVPMLEAQFENHPEFAEYKKTTSVFVPMPPKSS